MPETWDIYATWICFVFLLYSRSSTYLSSSAFLHLQCIQNNRYTKKVMKEGKKKSHQNGHEQRQWDWLQLTMLPILVWFKRPNRNCQFGHRIKLCPPEWETEKEINHKSRNANTQTHALWQWSRYGKPSWYRGIMRRLLVMLHGSDCETNSI